MGSVLTYLALARRPRSVALNEACADPGREGLEDLLREGFLDLAVLAVEVFELTVEPGENFVARALETYEAREFDHAVAYLEAEIAERPQRAWTHYMLGLALWKSGRLDEAEAAMEPTGEEFDPDAPRPYDWRDE
jgi:tetratricopeptide (TPR) repeat protein